MNPDMTPAKVYGRRLKRQQAKAAESKLEGVEQLLSDICHQLHRHEVQYWLDAPGTLEQRSRIALMHAQEALALVRELK